MKKRNYLIGILVSLFVIALAFTSVIYFYGRLAGKVIEYRDLAAIFTAVIVSGSFIAFKFKAMVITKYSGGDAPIKSTL
jgi:hypothetical protein